MTYKYKGRGLVQLTGRGVGKSTLADTFRLYNMLGQYPNKESYELIIERSEGRVFGARYWTVHPVIHPVWDQNPATWHEMMAWMIETFGPTADDGVFTPSQRWYANNAKFWFREEADLLVFLLKWQ